VARSGPLPSSGGTELERLRATVSSYFPVYETRIGPQSLLLAVHIDRATLEEKFDALRRELWASGYVPLLRRESGEDFVEVIRRPRTRTTRQWVNLALLAATVATTVFAGSMIWVTYVGGTALGLSDVLNGALYFAAPLLAILGVHEFAHYWVARRRHLDASLPFFIPIPPPFLFGTFGAFVSIRTPFPDRKALFDVGAAGPIAGFLVSVPVALAGLYLTGHAPSVPVNYCGVSFLGQSYGNILLGPSLFWTFLSLFLPPGFQSLHPLALAGWVGIFVTAINLLPAGSLDGGHVFRALLGDRSRFVSYSVVILLFGLGFFYYGWLLFAILVLFLGMRHPPPLNDLTHLDPKRYAVGAFVAAVLISGFVVVPLSAAPGTVSLGTPQYAVLPAHPGEVSLNLSVNVTNGDPVDHGYGFTATLTEVTLHSAGTNTTLNSSQVMAWAENATWTYTLANGSRVTVTGVAGALPSSDYLTIATGATVPVRVTFTNSFPVSETVLVAYFELSASQDCAVSGTGAASTAPFAVVFS